MASKKRIFLPSLCTKNEPKSLSYFYVINQSPLALRRPRYSYSRIYDSQKNEKLIMGITLKSQHDVYQEGPITGLLHFDFNFFFKLPVNKNKRASLIEQKYHNYKPDISNLIKMVEDICVDAGIIQDDSLISSICSKKLYCVDGEPRTEFVITRLQ